MNITKQDLADQRELIQDDLMCILDGLDQQVLDRVCQVIIDRIKILEDKLEEFTCNDVESYLDSIERDDFTCENGDTGVPAWHDCPT